MPDEVYECIVQQLEGIYFSDASGTCVSCYTRDLYNLSFTSHSWYRAARQQLYGKIWLATEDNAGTSNLPWQSIKLLRRTLRERPILARFVREMHFPDAQIVYQESAMQERQATINQLASLVMSAPNLEKFSGLYLTYDHIFDRLTHALSTRTQLKEKTWVLRRSEVGVDDEGVYWSNHDEFGQAENHDAFLRSHDQWKNLNTLCLFGQTTGRMDYRAFVGTFRNLPALKHLLVSDFDASQFSDRTLFALPPILHSLRLQEVSGITEKGLMRFFRSPAAALLRNISLVKIEVTSAHLIASIFASCTLLKRFTLAQNISPSFTAPITSAATALYASKPTSSTSTTGIYASKTLQYLHWDTIAYGPSLTDLATSISSGALPSLYQLRAPSDDGGILQRLCAPSANLATPADSSADLLEEENPFSHSSLPSARRLAQKRKEEASKAPFIKIVVSNEEGVQQHTYTLRTFMGTLHSRVKYCLDPDIPGSEDAIAGLNDLLVSREILIEGEKYCSDELHVAGRGSFESGNSGGSGGSTRTNVRSRNMGRAKKVVVENKGHRMRKILASPDMSAFF